MKTDYIEDLIKGATYQYNGDERDMTKGKKYVIDRVTSDYIELKDDHGELHQFTRSEYPKFELVSLPSELSAKNIDPELEAAAKEYVTTHKHEEVRLMYGHHIRTFLAGATYNSNKNLDAPKRPITDLLEDDEMCFAFMEIVGQFRYKHFAEALIEKRMYVINWKESFEVYEFLVKNNFDLSNLLTDNNG